MAAGGGGLPIPSGWADCEVFEEAACPSDSEQALCKTAPSTEGSKPAVAGAPQSKKKRGAGGATVGGAPRACVQVEDDMQQQSQLTQPMEGAGPLHHLTVTPSIRRQQEKDVLGQNSTASSLETIGSAIRSSKNFASRTKLCELNLDSVLSSTSYRNIMRQTFGTDGSIAPTSSGQAGSSAVAAGGTGHGGGGVKIPTITRTFEESYMREPRPNERECARGPKCECMYIDQSLPFVAVEFLTIEEIANQPPDNQLCVVCSRKETQYLYYDMVFNRKVYNGVIQRYGNVSGANEYASECLLRCTKSGDLSCMPKPIMSHQRNRYTVYRHPDLDLLCLRQTRVSPHDHVSSAAVENPVGCIASTQCLALSSTAKTTPAAAGVPRAGKNRGF